MYKHPRIESRCLLASTVVAVATALSMSSAAFAADPPAAATSAPQQTAACAADTEPMTGTHIRRDCDAKNLETVHVFGGAVLRPGDAQWADDDKSAPELPMTRDPEAVKR